MVCDFGQHIYFAFQDLALILVAVAQVIPLKALVISVKLVCDTASQQTAWLELDTDNTGQNVWCSLLDI